MLSYYSTSISKCSHLRGMLLEHLKQSDLRSLLSFLRNCYAIRDYAHFDDFVRQLVAELPHLIPAAHVTYNEMYPDDSKSYNWVNTSDLATPIAASLWEHHMNEHPVMEHVKQTDDRHAVRISDFLSERQLHDTGLHCDFYRHYGIEDALCITVPSSAPLFIGVGWHDDRVFTDRERLIADLVRPHIAQAWLNAKAICEMRAGRELYKQAFETEHRATISCDSQGAVQFMTDLARHLLSEYFGPPTSGHDLPEQLLAWMRHENSRMEQNDIPSARLSLVVQKEKKRLTIRLMSNSESSLLVLDEDTAALPEAEIANQYGLSAREVEVLTWVVQGKTNSEIATILGISARTAKKHLEHIFEKLGVETRTAAAAMLLQRQSRSDTH